MCEPTTLLAISIATSVASAGAGIYAQNQAGKAQADALQTQAQAQADEQTAVAELEMGTRVKQARAERARMRVAAGESGISGASFEAQLSNSMFQQNQDNAITALDTRFANRANEARLGSGLAQIQLPTIASAGLQLAGAGFSGYTRGVSVNNTLKDLKVGSKGGSK